MFTRKKNVILGMAIALLVGGSSDILLANGDSQSMPTNSSLPTYKCYKVPNNAIQIDGKLDEFVWKDKPLMEFREIEKGTPPKYQSVVRLVWNDEYLYVGMELEAPNVWGRWGVKDSEVEKQKNRFVMWDPLGWGRVEAKIMQTDPFVKIFIDPDADGKNYLEFHINALNNVYDSHVEYGFKERWGDTGLLPLHMEWTCKGFKSAVQIQGTLNYPDDCDKGWSVEVAIPWESFKEFTKGSCPPKVGDKWKAHLGRVYKTGYREVNHYWTWPVIGAVNCHLLDRYGYLVFCNADQE